MVVALLLNHALQNLCKIKGTPFNCNSIRNRTFLDLHRELLIIADLREEFIANGDPIISVDTKKKELIGLFRNSGQTWCRKAIKVKDHDFRSEAKGIAVPYGMLDIVRNYGFLVVGESADTPEFLST